MTAANFFITGCGCGPLLAKNFKYDKSYSGDNRFQVFPRAADTLGNAVGRLRAVCFPDASCYKGWLGSRVVSVLDSAQKGPGSNRSRDAVG